MDTCFLESSALVKRYLEEPGSAWISGVVAHADYPIIFISILARVEIPAALARAERMRRITPRDRDLVWRKFDEDRRRFEVVYLSDEVLKRAGMLVREYPLRALDALQLASALAVQERRTIEKSPISALVFICADELLNEAARDERLQVENPSEHQ